MSEFVDNSTGLAMLVNQSLERADEMPEEERCVNPVDTGDRRIVFLSGKMTGLSDWGKANFRHWERFFRSQGRLVMNPAVLPTDMPGEVYMPITLAMLDQCDEVFMIPGWTDSSGAMIERNYAIKCGKDITYHADYAMEYDTWIKETKQHETDVSRVDF